MRGRGSLLAFLLFSVPAFAQDFDGTVSLAVGPGAVPWGGWATGRLTLSKAAPASGATVQISVPATSAGVAIIPGQVLIPANATSAKFQIRTQFVATDRQVPITASIGGRSAVATFSITSQAPLTIPSADIVLRDREGRTADGIVCDNSAYVSGSQENRLNVSVVGATSQRTVAFEVTPAGRPVVHGGKAEESAGYAVYRPPLEFNANPNPATLNDIGRLARRDNALRVLVQNADGTWQVGQRPLILGRVPMVLVHGINSDPGAWAGPLDADGKPKEPRFYYKAWSGLNARNRQLNLPMLAINHASYDENVGLNGRGFVETGARELARGIDLVLNAVRQGEPIPQVSNLTKGAPWRSPFSFTTSADARPVKLAIRRVDVLAHSYGGAITRWYLAKRNGLATTDWYRNLDAAWGMPADAPLYRGDVRKVITLGSMWRGTPLANVLSEINASRSEAIPFGNAEVHYSIPFVINLNTTLDEAVKKFEVLGNAAFPTYQVMAVESNWLRQMVYGTATPGSGTPVSAFRADVAYASVAGDNAAYPLVGSAKGDPFLLLRTMQEPSWFPYLSMEVKVNSVRNYHDGLVPIWSAAIPGSYRIAPVNHSDVLLDNDTFEYVVCALNSTSMPGGATLNANWNSGSVVTSGGYQWGFVPGRMAPTPQNLLFENRGGTARLALESVRELDTLQITSYSSAAVHVRFRTRHGISKATLSIQPVGQPALKRTFEGSQLAAGMKAITGDGPFPAGDYVLWVDWEALDPVAQTVVKLKTREIKFQLDP